MDFMKTINMVRISTPESLLKPLWLRSLEIFSHSLERTDAKDKNGLEFEEFCCIVSMVFSRYLFDLARNIITQNTIKITIIYMIFNIKTVIFYFKTFNSNPVQE